MSVSQTQHTMDVEDTATMYGAELCISDGDEKHAANVDGLWLSLGEVEEIYTVVVEGDINKRETYPLDELPSITFHHNYDGSYSIEDVVTLDADEWEDICEWFMEQLGEDGYVNALHEYLETDDSVVDWEKSGDFISVDVAFIDEVNYFEVTNFDVQLRTVNSPYVFARESDAFVSIEGPDVEEIIEENTRNI